MRLISLFATLPAPHPLDPSVTGRERDVLLAVEGRRSDQETAHLHLGYGTVGTHVSALLQELG